MTFFEQELEKLFGKSRWLEDVRIVGNTCYCRLTEDIRAKIQFTECGFADHFEGLKVTLLNRREGITTACFCGFVICGGWERPATRILGTGSDHISGGTGERQSGMSTIQQKKSINSLPMRSVITLPCFQRLSRSRSRVRKCKGIAGKKKGVGR